jgi:uncharacterized RDD family membrane protein YckC
MVETIISHQEPGVQRETTISVHYAGFWVRFEALIIDLIICAPACIVLTIVIQSSAPENIIPFYLSQFFSGLIIILYFTMMECSPMQATFGKKAMRILVTDMEGRRISFLQSMARNLMKIISLSFFYIGFIMAAFTEKKQALHDLVAGCLVVRKRLV